MMKTQNHVGMELGVDLGGDGEGAWKCSEHNAYVFYFKSRKEIKGGKSKYESYLSHNVKAKWKKKKDS